MIKGIILGLCLALTSTAQAAWVHSVKEDKMGRGEYEVASIISNDTVMLQTPRKSEQYASFSLYRLKSKPGVEDKSFNAVNNSNRFALTIPGSFLLYGSDQGRLLLRADDHKPVTLEATYAEDGSSNTMVGELDVQTIELIKSARKIWIEVIIYQNGTHVFEFDSANNPFEGNSAHTLDALKAAASTGNWPAVEKKAEFTIDNTEYKSCIYMNNDKVGPQEVARVIVNDANSKVIEVYSESSMKRSTCSNKDKSLLIEKFIYQ